MALFLLEYIVLKKKRQNLAQSRLVIINLLKTPSPENGQNWSEQKEVDRPPWGLCIWSLKFAAKDFEASNKVCEAVE